MKLLVEQCVEYNAVYESAKDDDNKKNLYIEGIFMQANTKNRNGRVYPKNILEKEANRYIKENINTRTAYGELDHPPTPNISGKSISHRVTSLKEDGNNYIGKALIMPTPMGNIVKAIIESGGQLGVSSRGMGSVKRIGDVLQVQEDFRLATCADIVTNPSVVAATVNGIYESILDTDWVYDNVKQEWIAEPLLGDLKKTTSNNLNESDILRSWQLLINTLKTQ